MPDSAGRGFRGQVSGRQGLGSRSMKVGLTPKNRRNRLHFYLSDYAADRSRGEAQNGDHMTFDEYQVAPKETDLK
jgi:hypothetical protein